MNILIQSKKYRLTKTGVVFDNSLTYEEWEAFGKELQKVRIAIQWWLGDWILWGEQKFGEKYTQAIEETGLDYGTLANYVYVCRSIEFSRRREKLSFSVHAEVAPLPIDKQDELLDRAEKEGLHSRDVRQLVQEVKQQECQHEPIVICKKCRKVLEGFKIQE
uniref:Uncharacterized protein n=1 Tax=Caldisericum exile TaxID=693075 RepID=A0A7C4TW48_9BACT